MGGYLPVPSEEKEFELAPAGTHQAVCIGVIDYGTQETEYEGQKSNKHQVQLVWELSNEPMKDGRPFTIRSRRYTWSTSRKAALRKDLESWRGQPFKDTDFGPDGFNIRNLLGANCLLSVIHREGSKGGTFANVSSISPLAKGMNKAEPQNDLIWVWLDRDDFDWNAFEKLGNATQIAISQSPEFKVVRGDAVGLEAAEKPGQAPEVPQVVSRKQAPPIETLEDVPF